MPEFKRGRAAIDRSANSPRTGGSSSGGGGISFPPSIFWRNDQEEKYLKFLTPMSEVPTIYRYHEWIPVTYKRQDGSSFDRKNEHFISRRDDCIGEDYDDLEDRLEMSPRMRSIGVAVELDPVYETKGGRKRPASFNVLVNESNEVKYPQIGLVIQSPANFWGFLSAYDATEQPVEDVVFRVQRQGKGPETSYNFFPVEKEVDLSGLIDNISNIRYLSSDLDENDTSAETIAQTLLEKRLEELADPERYRKLVSPIQSIKSPFSGDGSGGNNNPGNSGNHNQVLQDLKADIAAR